MLKNFVYINMYIEFWYYPIGEQRRLRPACTFKQSCQSLHFSPTQSMDLEEDSHQNLHP